MNSEGSSSKGPSSPTEPNASDVSISESSSPIGLFPPMPAAPKRSNCATHQYLASSLLLPATAFPATEHFASRVCPFSDIFVQDSATNCRHAPSDIEAVERTIVDGAESPFANTRSYCFDHRDSDLFFPVSFRAFRSQAKRIGVGQRFPEREQHPRIVAPPAQFWPRRQCIL